MTTQSDDASTRVTAAVEALVNLPVRTPDALSRAIDRLRRSVLQHKGFSDEEMETLGDRRIRELTDEQVERLLEGRSEEDLGLPTRCWEFAAGSYTIRKRDAVGRLKEQGFSEAEAEACLQERLESGRLETLSHLNGSAAYRMTSLWLADMYEGERNGSRLTERERLVLSVLLAKSAFDSDHRVPTKAIAAGVAGKTTGKCPLKHVIAGLKKRRYLDTLVGRSGGCWLTPLGRRRAEQL